MDKLWKHRDSSEGTNLTNHLISQNLSNRGPGICIFRFPWSSTDQSILEAKRFGKPKIGGKPKQDQGLQLQGNSA